MRLMLLTFVVPLALLGCGVGGDDNENQGSQTAIHCQNQRRALNATPFSGTTSVTVRCPTNPVTDP